MKSNWLKPILLHLIFIVPFYGGSQNLVPNPSFEDYNTLPCTWVTGSADFNHYLKDWYIPTEGSSDIFSTYVGNSCVMSCYSNNPFASGTQTPRTGEIFTGFYAFKENPTDNGYKEYLAVELTTPLDSGDNYYCEMYVSLGDNSEVFCNNIGMFFTVNKLEKYKDANNGSFFSTLEKDPQINETQVVDDAQNWVKISGNFVADSAYKFLNIGNFFSSANTNIVGLTSQNSEGAFYFVDDVLVKRRCAIVDADTTICAGDSVVISRTNNCQDPITVWAEASSPNTILAIDSFIKVAPDSTTTYLMCTLPGDTQYVTVFVNNQVSLDLGPDTSICHGDSLFYDVSFPNASYLWNNGSTSPKQTIETPGLYWVKVSLGNCFKIDSINVTQPKFLDLGADTVLCLDQTLDLDVYRQNAQYIWSTNDTLSAITISDPGIYWVQIIENGCVLLDTIVVEYKNCEVGVEMPNIFTPNNDGQNDLFVPTKYNNINSASIQIFNRWGNLIYTGSEILSGWDGRSNGKPSPDGQYFYVLKYLNTNNETVVITGSFALMR